MKKLPLGIQNFREIIKGNYVYVDKTQYVYNLINDAKYYFLSRPRRFGKSLLLDTIAEVFSGDKELFNGLFIYDSDYSFEKHPVLRLDMSNIANETPETLIEELSIPLRERARTEGLDIDYNMPSAVFKTLIKALYIKYNKRVVVLIDEYDKPILDHIDDVEVAEANRKVLKGFYGILKSMDPYLELTFITGVSKFSKTSIFSELNNLLDITLTEKYSNICGIAIEDMDKYFGDHIEELASLEKFKRYKNIKDEILAWYDGYSWDGKTRVINPFSLFSFFIQKRFTNFWYASGTPSFLIKLIKEKPSSFLLLKNLEISERVLDTFDIRKMSAAPLLFQTGYLTMTGKSYRGDSESYLLGMPNHEVREAFNLNIIADFTENEEDFTETVYWQMKDSLKNGDLNNMLNQLKSLFASIPYQLHVNCEAYYHSIFYAIASVLGFDVDVEVSVSGGRVDAVLELEDKIYVMEFKYVDCPSGATQEVKERLFKEILHKAMDQINNKGYCKKYSGSEKTIYQVAFAFIGRDDIAMTSTEDGGTV